MNRMNMPVILTGLRANNDLHIGNYFGGLLPIIDMAKKLADEYQINLFVPDLHSFTTPIDHSKLQDQIKHALKVFVSAGLPLGHSNVHIYRQSRIPAHSELTVILNSFTGMGEMSRMTQYKEKLDQIGKDRVSVGLFDYPVLMVSDILLYGAKYVPVGDDQTQHIEITRDLGQRMNAKFQTELFTIPEEVKKQHEFFGNPLSSGQGLRIKDLVDPSKKMSKSDETGKGVIFLSDPPGEAKKKVMSATTDSVGKVSQDYVNQPGISNLLDIYKLLGGSPDEFIGQEQYGPLKEAVAEKVGEFLSDFQTKLSQVDNERLQNKLEESESKMNRQANATLERVQKAVGLR